MTVRQQRAGADTITVGAVKPRMHGAGAAARVVATRPSAGASHSRLQEAAKRSVDVLLAAFLLVCLVPLLILVAVAVRLDSGGPVLFRQERLGRQRRPFRVLKFRTMYTNASEDVHRRYIAALAADQSTAGGLKKLTADPRVTRVGRFLRRSSLDELPQLVNVLRGEMSLVGPRPALAYELEHYAPGHFDRFAVRPGVTGLWQVSGRNRLGFSEMLELDAHYARRRGLLLDLLILAKTPLAVFGKHAA